VGDYDGFRMVMVIRMVRGGSRITNKLVKLMVEDGYGD